MLSPTRHALLSAALALAATPVGAAPPPLAYRVSNVRLHASAPVARQISIQTVQIESGADLSGRAIARANRALREAARTFQREALGCAAVEHSGPWEFDLRFEKAAYSARHISFVFSSFAVCTASPILAKAAVVIDRSSGRAVAATELFRAVLPRQPVPEAHDYGKIRLDSDTADKLLADNERELDGHRRDCEPFLRGTAYSVWAEGSGLILYPEFVQPSSYCQIEYRLNGFQ
jgi:hypothetical protein